MVALVNRAHTRGARRYFVMHALSYAELAQLVHDFKTPLSLVALETQVLQSQLDDGAHVDMVHAITRVLLNLDYIDRMMHDVIDSCAIDAGHFEIHRAPTDLWLLLETVTTRMATTRDRHRIVLERSDSLTIKIDSLRIERVVANLVHNALKYSAEDTRVFVRMSSGNGVARVSVSDAGPGISRDEVEHLFEEYRRSSAAHVHDSSGLGLYVSKRIVEAHGGRIGVNTATGLGSEFYFELPIR
jgi:signal transduction histidine kinase